LFTHNLLEFLEKTYAECGDKTAVEAVDGSYSFSQLHQKALEVAIAVSSNHDCYCAKKMVVVYMPKGARLLCAMLGVLYSGNVYVPMDCRAPINRTKLIIDIIDPVLIITDDEGYETLIKNDIPETLLAKYSELVEHNIPIPEGYAANTIALSQDVDPAYILFTSGSTGVPKGVVIPHRRVLNYIMWARDFFSIGSEEVIGNQAPFYFTVSAMDIYLCLATGSKLCIIPEDRFSRPEKLLLYLNEKKISLIFWVSSVYHHIANMDALRETRLEHLRRAWFVGEPMPINSLIYWMERLPGVEFTNLYGSTETDMTIVYRIPEGIPLSSIPLGCSCANTAVLLFNDDLTPAKSGEISEIYIRGSCLASGYFKDLEKTRSSFIQNPLHNDYTDILYKTGDLGEERDGLIYFHGRRDHQFKHLGYRIEAGEIEAIAAQCYDVKSACVLYDSGKRQIVLFYESAEQIDELAYRRALMENLPVYMVPTRYVRLSAMPYNANRKKDRVLLKSQYIQAEET